MYKLVKIDEKYFVETSWFHQTEPKVIIVQWPILLASYIPDPIPDFEVKPESTVGDHTNWTLYCGQGQYMTLVTPKYGQSSERDVPPPKVRKETEIRWKENLGGWQKYDKRKGWIFA